MFSTLAILYARIAQLITATLYAVYTFHRCLVADNTKDFNSGQKSGGCQANTGVTVSTDTYVESHFSYEAPKMGLNRILAKGIPHDSVDDLEAGMTLSTLPVQMTKEDWADDSESRVHI